MIAIVTPTVMEMQSFLNVSDNTFIHSTIELADAGYIEQGYINGIPTYIGICGVGPVLSGITVSSWLSKYNIDYLLLCGIAGAYSIERFPPTSVVFVTQDIYADYGIRTKEGVHAQSFPFLHDKKHEIREKLVTAPPQYCLESAGLHYTMCTEAVGITVAGISADSTTKQILCTSYPHADIETMEGFSVGLSCIRTSTSFIHVRSISNEVGIRSGWALEEALHSLATTLLSFWSKP